jgi:hypothetical protein
MSSAKTSGSVPKKKKKTRQGKGKYTKSGSKGGGVDGSTKSKNYKKKYRGQGK